MRTALTVIALVLLVAAMAWGVAACSSDETAATQTTSHPMPTVMGITTQPTWSHQIIIDSGAPTTLQTTTGTTQAE